MRDGVEMSYDEAKSLAKKYFDEGQCAKVEALPLESAIRKFQPGSEDLADFQRGYESNFEQADWEVRLSGNPQDLRQLNDLPGGADYFRIFGGVDHWHDCPSDEYSFNSSYFALQNDPIAVINIAQELVNLFNSAAELFRKDYDKQRITGVYFKGRPVNIRKQPVGWGLLGRLPMSPNRWNEMMESAMLSGPRLPILLLATEHSDVQQILRYLALPADWGTYYKLLETLETYAARNGTPFPNKYAARSAFTNNANNYSVTGLGARHGEQEEKRPNTVKPMSLEEAHTFITGVCKLYFNTVYGKYFAFEVPPGIKLADKKAS